MMTCLSDPCGKIRICGAIASQRRRVMNTKSVEVMFGMSTEASPTVIGLYGGSFNPPHTAHVLVAAWALSCGEVDRIWVFPTGGHPFGKDLAPFEDRMAMCRGAFAPFGDRVRVLDIEREPRVHYSVETVERLRAENPDLGWRWLMGSDTFADAPQWRRFDDLMDIAPALAIPRAGYPSAGAGSFALPNVSSTLVRRMLAGHDWTGLEGLLPRPVAAHIRERGLYGAV